MTRGSTLLAFDFDGTLAPIADDPAGVQMSRAAEALLREMTQIRGVAVAIASGRDVDDLIARTGLPGAYMIGSHGLEIRAPGGVPVRDSPPLSADVERGLRTSIEKHGLRLERKKHAIALHWRGLDEEAAAATLRDFREWAEDAGLETIEGRCVVEARCPGGGKEDALRWLASAIGAARVIYAGDDLTDFGALRFAAERGRGVFVANSERVPPPGVTVVDSFTELFRLIREEVLI
ncbi:MAG TPA: trehalose-phosphatase [Thermoanaerobaculia bacterium]|nr:trehalose-phosphatase [Thermoanaerobaculia bacterium]